MFTLTDYLTDLEAIHANFCANVEWADAIDIAVAWMTPGPALDALLKFVDAKRTLRIVVGCDFDHTSPDAVESLWERIPQCIRWVRSISGTFHPKLYIFKKQQEVRLLIGSPNLTRAAFTKNVEIACAQTTSPGAITHLQQFWTTTWEQANKITGASLEKYREQYERRTAAVFRGELNTSNMLAWDWPAYRDALELRAAALERCGMTLRGRQEASIETMRQIADVLQHPIESLDRDAKKALIGLETDAFPGAAFLGRNKGNGKAVSLLTQSDHEAVRTQERITKILRRIPKSPEPLLIAQVKQAYGNLREIDNIGPAIATRLLALYRGDYLVSTNGAAKEGLSDLFQIPQTRVLTWAGYAEMLERLWEAPWMQSSRPRDSDEAQMWEYRAALVDFFAYRPTQIELPRYNFSL